MSVITVGLEDTFNQWRLKTNQLGSTIGDSASLQTTSTDLVSAINEVRSNAVVDGILTTYGSIFKINVDPEDTAELILDTSGNLTITGRLNADVNGNLYGNAATATKLAVARIITMTGDASWNATFDGSANVTADLTLNYTGVAAGDYTKVTVDVGGRVTAGTALSSTDVTTALGYIPVSEEAGYNDPIWLTGLSGEKISNTSSMTIANITMGNRLFLANGSATQPSLAFSADTDQNTGLYWGNADGYMFFANNGVKSGETQPGGNLIMVGNVGGYSDIRLKKDVETIRGALDIVNRLRGIYYTSISSNERSVGVVAQEVEREIPELIRVGADGMLSVSYGNMGGLLLQAINELTDRVKAIEAKLN
jgi:hypothetical protein